MNRKLMTLLLGSLLMTGCALDGLSDETAGATAERQEVERVEMVDGVFEIAYDDGSFGYLAQGVDGARALYELARDGVVTMDEQAREQLTEDVRALGRSQGASQVTMCSETGRPMYATTSRSFSIKASAGYEGPDFGPHPYVEVQAFARTYGTEPEFDGQINHGYANTYASASVYAPSGVPGYARAYVKHDSTGCYYRYAVQSW